MLSRAQRSGSLGGAVRRRARTIEFGISRARLVGLRLALNCTSGISPEKKQREQSIGGRRTKYSAKGRFRAGNHARGFQTLLFAHASRAVHQGVRSAIGDAP